MTSADTRADDLSRALNEPVELVAYQPAWAAAGRAECQRLQRALAGQVRQVRHIGSTAVPGMSAKPIIDVIAGFDSLDQGMACLPRLEALGYVYVAEQNRGLLDRRWMLRQLHGRRTHHLHLVGFDTTAWRDRTRFCELLQTQPAVRERYEALKRELSARFGEQREAYSEAKSDFIAQCLRAAT